MTEYHYFNLVFGGIGKQHGVINRIVRMDNAYVTHAQIEAIRAQELIDDQAPLIGVNYLGRMTEEQWSNELWQTPESHQTSQRWTPYQKCLTGLLVALGLLVSALAVMMYLNPPF